MLLSCENRENWLYRWIVWRCHLFSPKTVGTQSICMHDVDLTSENAIVVTIFDPLPYICMVFKITLTSSHKKTNKNKFICKTGNKYLSQPTQRCYIINGYHNFMTNKFQLYVQVRWLFYGDIVCAGDFFSKWVSCHTKCLLTQISGTPNFEAQKEPLNPPITCLSWKVHNLEMLTCMDLPGMSTNSTMPFYNHASILVHLFSRVQQNWPWLVARSICWLLAQHLLRVRLFPPIKSTALAIYRTQKLNHCFCLPPFPTTSKQKRKLWS